MDNLKLRRVASGDYETTDGAVRVWQVPDVHPAAWNAERVTDGAVLVDGARTLADAKALAVDALDALARLAERDALISRLVRARDAATERAPYTRGATVQRYALAAVLRSLGLRERSAPGATADYRTRTSGNGTRGFGEAYATLVTDAARDAVLKHADALAAVGVRVSVHVGAELARPVVAAEYGGRDSGRLQAWTNPDEAAPRGVRTFYGRSWRAIVDEALAAGNVHGARQLTDALAAVGADGAPELAALVSAAREARELANEADALAAEAAPSSFARRIAEGSALRARNTAAETDALAALAAEAAPSALVLINGASASTAPEHETRADAYARGALDARRIGLPDGIREADGLAMVRRFAADRYADDSRRAYWYGVARMLRQIQAERAARAVGALWRRGTLQAAAHAVRESAALAIVREAARTEDGPTYRVTRNGQAVEACDGGWVSSADALVSALYLAEAEAIGRALATFSEADAETARELARWRVMIAPETEHEAPYSPDGRAAEALQRAALALVDGDARGAHSAIVAAALALVPLVAPDGTAPAALVFAPEHTPAVLAALALACGTYAVPDGRGGPLDAIAAVSTAGAAGIRETLARRGARLANEPTAQTAARDALRAALAAVAEADSVRVGIYARRAVDAAERAYAGDWTRSETDARTDGAAIATEADARTEAEAD